MSTSKQSTIQVTGLVIQPNPYASVPAGSLSQALNCVSRRKGVLEALPGNEALFNSMVSGTPVRIFNQWENSYFIALQKADGVDYAEYLRFGDSNTMYTSVLLGGVTRTLRFDPGASQATYSRNRHILSEHSAPICVESFSTTSHGLPRVMGLPPPLFAKPNQGGGTPANSSNGFVSYRAIFRKRYTNFVVDSSPSPVGVTQTTAGGSLSATVYFDNVADPIQIGDLVVLYRAKTEATIAAIGDDYRQVVEYELTSADIVAGVATIQDRVMEADLEKGAPLYTNSRQEGATQANLMPPACVDVATYNDTTFYVTKNSWPVVSLSIPGSLGGLSTVDQRLNGIGIRTITGANLLGSPNVTGVADVTGIGLGQLVIAPGRYSAGTRVLSVSGAGPFTVTMDTNAIGASGAAPMFIVDTLEVRGYKDGALVTSGYAPMTVDLDLFARDLAAAVPGIKVQINSVYEESGGRIEALDFAIWSPIPGIYDRIEVDVTNGGNYATRGTVVGTLGSHTSIQDTKTNRVYYSKTSLPEAVPPLNFFDVGNERVMKLWPSESALFAFCTDGLWRITGSGTDWTVNQLDRTTSLVHPDCVDATDNKIFAWLTEGISAVGENGAETISREAIGPALDAYLTEVRLAGAPFSWGPQLACDHRRREVWLNIATRGTSSFFHLQTYIFNFDSGAFTHQTATPIRSLAYSDYRTALITCDSTNYFVPSATTWQSVTVTFNPIFAQDLGQLKEWIDTNLFIDNVSFAGGSNSVVQILFQGETAGANNKFTVDSTTVQNLHCWVPRRASSKTQLVFGFKTNPDTSIKMNFRCYGFTVRYRVASETIKR